MDNLNHIFFEKYARLNKLCGEMYNTPNGVSSYIDDMKTARGEWIISGWEADLERLKKLRHLRNQLAHEPGGFDIPVCTQSDIDWLAVFYHKVMNQTDPLSLLYKKQQAAKVREQQYQATRQKVEGRAAPPAQSKKEGCYIASCVYGSYDCPSVWVLRHYRDIVLRKKWYVRIFIQTYYTISPLFVKYLVKFA